MSTTLLLITGIALLMVDSAIELAWVSNMVHWLHAYAGGQFEVSGPFSESYFSLHGKPEHLLLDQGHVSNAAAGLALIPISLGGFLVLYLRRRQLTHRGHMQGFPKFLYFSWLTFTVISALFTLVALIYVMVVTSQHAGQKIDVALASSLRNQAYPNYVAYPLQEWTPQNWFSAVLDLQLASSVRNEISFQLTLMRGWQWNLIPMFIIGVAVAVLAVRDHHLHRRDASHGGTEEKLSG